eukprot:Lithocolla_globosa_v1_NODE_4618_length_1398_cov_15.274554.p3 type:complete len:101 gc:universal NODE_4618_length_1398_cov_15.274554:794-1096(+)
MVCSITGFMICIMSFSIAILVPRGCWMLCCEPPTSTSRVRPEKNPSVRFWSSSFDMKISGAVFFSLSLFLSFFVLSTTTFYCRCESKKSFFQPLSLTFLT